MALYSKNRLVLSRYCQFYKMNYFNWINDILAVGVWAAQIINLSGVMLCFVSISSRLKKGDQAVLLSGAIRICWQVVAEPKQNPYQMHH